jgi:hypothetical protein
MGYREELSDAGDVDMWLSCAAHVSVGFIFPSRGVYRLPAPSLIGTSSLYCVAVALHRLPIHLVLIGRVAISSGYLGSWFKGLLRYDDLEFRRFPPILPAHMPAHRKRAGFGWFILNGQSRLYFPGMVAGVSVAGFFLWFGIHRFRRTENSFADPT